MRCCAAARCFPTSSAADGQAAGRGRRLDTIAPGVLPGRQLHTCVHHDPELYPGPATCSGPSASSSKIPGPTPGSRSAAGGGAASGRASRCSRCGSCCGPCSPRIASEPIGEGFELSRRRSITLSPARRRPGGARRAAIRCRWRPPSGPASTLPVSGGRDQPPAAPAERRRCDQRGVRALRRARGDAARSGDRRSSSISGSDPGAAQRDRQLRPQDRSGRSSRSTPATLYTGFVVTLVADVRDGKRDFTVGELLSSASARDPAADRERRSCSGSRSSSASCC